MSELMSLVLFLASIGVYAWKAGRHTWWFVATLVVLGIFIVLNITLYASDYFTGDGINDAVLYTGQKHRGHYGNPDTLRTR